MHSPIIDVYKLSDILVYYHGNKFMNLKFTKIRVRLTSYSAYKNLNYISKNNPRIDTDIISGHSSLDILSRLVYNMRGMVEVQ